MDRRVVLATVGLLGAGAGFPLAGRAQSRTLRVGILRPGAKPESPDDPQIAGIPNALRKIGYLPGHNLVVDVRFAGGRIDVLPALAGELVRAPVDVIVAVSAACIDAARAATTTTPIVMFGNFDPVELGFVPNLARPGGNITGVLITPDGTLAGKRLELLRAAVPQSTRIAMLAAADDLANRLQIREARKAALALGIDLAVIEVHGGDYDAAFVSIVAAKPAALFVGASSRFMRDRAAIIALAARNRLPAMYEWREQVVDGGLMSYNTQLDALFQRIASYIDRIFKGAKPGDLPIEQPTRFELVVNAKTARTLGLAIPPGLRILIDETIE